MSTALPHPLAESWSTQVPSFIEGMPWGRRRADSHIHLTVAPRHQWTSTFHLTVAPQNEWENLEVPPLADDGDLSEPFFLGSQAPLRFQEQLSALPDDDPAVERALGAQRRFNRAATCAVLGWVLGMSAALLG